MTTDQPVKIVANLPYNVATPLLFGWFKRLACVELMVLMFQKEVALRLTAVPGTADYGRLASWPSSCAGSSACSTCRRPPSRHRPRSPPAWSASARGPSGPPPGARDPGRSPAPPSASAARCCAPASRLRGRSAGAAGGSGNSSRRGGRRSWMSGSSIAWPSCISPPPPMPRAAPARSSGTARRHWLRRARCSSR